MVEKIVKNEKKNLLEERDVERLKLYTEYEDGNAIGTVDNIRNVNINIWKDFKMISRLYGNNEGAALTAVVMAWSSNPVNMAKIFDMKDALKKKFVEDEEVDS